MNFSKNYFQTFTATGADPAVFTLVDHELVEGDKLRFETSNTLPAGLSLLTDYYVVYNGITTDTFQVSTTAGGTPIATTDTGTGVHKLIKRNRASLSPSYQDNR